jgi:molybdopterin-guanine dinucleotide biosynthesis protein A
LTVPCDSPLFPLDLLERLALGLARPHATIALAAAPEADRHGVLHLRAQPVFCLMRTTLLPDLRAYMTEGGRKIHTWTDLHQAVEVSFDTSTDDPHAFFNTNTPEQLDQLERT